MCKLKFDSYEVSKSQWTSVVVLPFFVCFYEIRFEVFSILKPLVVKKLIDSLALFRILRKALIREVTKLGRPL
jgi:hypothetical protein